MLKYTDYLLSLTFIHLLVQHKHAFIQVAGFVCKHSIETKKKSLKNYIVENIVNIGLKEKVPLTVNFLVNSNLRQTLH